ncbi:MAG: hypothetical protein ACREUM_11905 [Nitrosospira sp.]
MNTLRAATLLIGATLAGMSVFAAAHTEEYFDSVESPHGGQMRMSGPYHLELVAKDKEIVLYVMDHANSKLSAEGGSGKATIQTGKDKARTSVKLEQAGDNILKGTGDFSVNPETVVTVFIELPGQEAHSARFTPLKPKAKLAMKTKDAKLQAADGNGHHHH